MVNSGSSPIEETFFTRLFVGVKISIVPVSGTIDMLWVLHSLRQLEIRQLACIL